MVIRTSLDHVNSRWCVVPCILKGEKSIKLWNKFLKLVFRFGLFERTEMYSRHVQSAKAFERITIVIGRLVLIGNTFWLEKIRFSYSHVCFSARLSSITSRKMAAYPRWLCCCSLFEHGFKMVRKRYEAETLGSILFLNFFFFWRKGKKRAFLDHTSPLKLWN